MKSANVTSKKITLYAAVMVMAALVGALLLTSFTGGSAQAQAPTGNAYDDPQPCGPGQQNPPTTDAAEEVPSGHYALFDVYWQRAANLGDEPDKETGSLNANLCPPSASHKEKTVFGKRVEETKRTASNININTTVIHVGEEHKAGVVAKKSDVTDNQLPLETYGKVRAGLGLGDNDSVPDGTEVYWLRLEDPDIEGNQTSSLVLGFSAGLLDKKYWNNASGGPTLQYELESVRVLGANPSDLPHVLAYQEPENRRNGKSVVVWDSMDTDTNAMPLEPGQYEHLEWIFTKPGTYVLSVHMKGHVRQTAPDNLGPGETWEKLSAVDVTVTSEVKEYVIQVGDLHINDQPHFGAVRTVTAGAPGGSNVGAEIPVFGTDADALEFDLNGVGSDNFTTNPLTTIWSPAVQIAVAEGANLVYSGANPDDPKKAYEDLHLTVSDGHGYEDFEDDAIDDIIPLRIFVTPQGGQPWISMLISDEHPRAEGSSIGETIRITAITNGSRDGWYTGDIQIYEGEGDQRREVSRAETFNNRSTSFSISNDKPGMQRYSVVLDYHSEDPNVPSERLASGWYPVTWRK